MIKPFITIRIKEVYGNTTYYPVCSQAKLFAKLIGQKTLTKNNLFNIKDLGYEVNVATEELGI